MYKVQRKGKVRVQENSVPKVQDLVSEKRSKAQIVYQKCTKCSEKSVEKRRKAYQSVPKVLDSKPSTRVRRNPSESVAKSQWISVKVYQSLAKCRIVLGRSFANRVYQKRRKVYQTSKCSTSLGEILVKVQSKCSKCSANLALAYGEILVKKCRKVQPKFMFWLVCWFIDCNPNTETAEDI